MRAARIIAALLIATSGQFAAGRYRRGAAFAVSLLIGILLATRLGAIPFFLIWVASVIDAAVIKPVPSDRTVGRQLLAVLVTGCVGLLVSVTVKSVWVEAFKIPAGSMVPTLLVGDHMFADKRARTPGRGDVVVFKYPKQPEKDFVKRVIAVGGDTIELKADGSLVLNGQPVARTHVDAPCEYDEILEEDGRVEKRGCEAWDETLDGRTYRVYLDRGRRERAFAPVSVGNDAYYVLGDNRDNSHDSRYWGMVPADHIRATARNLWFSYGLDGVRWDRLNLRIR